MRLLPLPFDFAFAFAVLLFAAFVALLPVPEPDDVAPLPVLVALLLGLLTCVALEVLLVAVDDFGNLINPMVVEGQVHGGIAQGIGQALTEGAVYDKESGQLLTGSYMDYCMPRADNLPNFKLDFTVTECPSNPLGIKGCGEAGAIAAPAAVMNAITDALGVADVAMPATPQTVWRAIQDAASADAAE